MRISKRTIVYAFTTTIILFLLFTFELPYYIYKPGQADNLEEMVEVEQGFQGTGELHLVTVSGGQATPIQYALAKLSDFHEVVPIEEARPEGISDDEYMEHQLMLMENSQHSSTFVAYEAANKEVTIEQNGVYVIGVVEDMPAEGTVERGDKIIQVDGKEIQKADDLVQYVQQKSSGDRIELQIEREGEMMTETIQVVSFPEDNTKVGVGIQLVTDQEVVVDPPVHIKSGRIGGPSAGLMFALEIYNQLTEEDVTKGYHIAGTGEIDFDGNVHRIGGIDKKIVAADQKGIEIFFAPNENGNKGSNYEIAKETAEEIDSTMKIVPVDTFQDTINYLERVEPK